MNTFNLHFNDYFSRAIEAIKRLNINDIEAVVTAILKTYNNNGTLLIFGNGGSGATASHVAGDFIKGISYNLEKRFRILSLNDNMAGITAISNDLSYDDVFIEQLKNFLTPNDLVIGISGSGNSLNVVNALVYANEQNATTVAICGYKGGKIKQIADFSIHVAIEDMEITEDIHLMIFHAIKQALMKELKKNQTSMGEKYDKRIEC